MIEMSQAEILNSETDVLKTKQHSKLVVLEFKVSGLSCVNCSNTVESAVQKGFSQLESVQITLLTHKMRCAFAA